MSSQAPGMDNIENARPAVFDTIMELDTEYQAAVKNNDVAAMDRILADDMVLVTGNGSVYTKSDLLEEAAGKPMIYERQEDTKQTVRLWGDTAVITALLWAKGTNRREPFEYKVWFSDTYVLTPIGWRYAFGQSAQRLPETEW